MHETWEDFSSHEVISLDRLKGDVTKLVPPQKTISYCPKHPSKQEDLYCETCEELICRDCIVRVHRDHQYDLVTDAYPRHKKVIISRLQPIEQQLGTVNQAVKKLDARCQQISDQRATIETTIQKTIRQLQESLEVRKTELVSQLDRLTQQKLKSLAAQRDQFELIQTRLSSCLDFVNESLRTGSEGEVLGMKKPVVKQIEEVTAEFQPEVLVPKEQSDLKFSCNAELRVACQQFGRVRSDQVSPENCYMTGNGVEAARVGEEATATLHTMDTEGQECENPIENIACELLSCHDASTVKCGAKRGKTNKYEIRYSPTTRGQHQLHVKVDGKSVKGSPFTVVVSVPIEKLGTPIRTIGGLNRPWGVAVNERGEIIVAENGGHCVSIFSPQGEKIRTFGSEGSAPGEFSNPKGVAVDRDGKILVTDCGNHCIQKFSPDGKFIKSVGTGGNGPLQFNGPVGITVSQEGRIYVCDSGNNQVHVLNPDLTFHSCFGSRGSDNGQFQCPYGVAFDSRGNVYVADQANHRIQVLTVDGQFLRMFGKYGTGDGELRHPFSVTIDSNDMVFVADESNNRVSVFTSQGQFVRSFGAEGTKPGQFGLLRGITLDRHGLLYVSDKSNNRLQIF